MLNNFEYFQSTLHVIGWSSGATDSMSSTQNLTETQEGMLLFCCSLEIK